MKMQAQIPRAQIKNGNMLAEELLNAISKRNPSPPSADFAKSPTVHSLQQGDECTVDHATRLENAIAANVQWRKPRTLQQILLESINRVKSATTPEQRAIITHCYDEWADHVQAGDDRLLTDRGGKAWVRNNVPAALDTNYIHRTLISAIVDMYHAFAFRDRIIERNPDYTGKAPYSRFRRKIKWEDM